MKKTITLLLCLICLKGFAQSYKSELVNVNTLHYPSFIQNKDVNTYTLKFNIPANDSYYGTIILPNLKSVFELNSFAEVFTEGKNAIEINIGSMTEVKTGIEEVKGSSANSESSYYYKLSGRIPYSIKIYDTNGKMFFNDDIGNTRLVNYKSESFKKYEDALNFYSPGRPGSAALKSALQGSLVAMVKNEILASVKRGIDYYTVSNRENFYTFKTNKKENYDDWNNVLNEVNAAFKNIIPGKDRTEFNASSQKAKAFYISKLATLDPLNKDQENQFTAASINLATLYFWGDMNDSTLFYITEARKVKDKTAELNRIEKDVQTKIEKMAKLKAADINYYEGLIKPKGAAANTNQSLVVTNTDQISQDEYFNNMIKDSKNFIESEGSITTNDSLKVNTSFKKFKVFTESELSQYSGQTFYVYKGKWVKLFSQPIIAYELDGFKYELINFFSATEVGVPARGWAVLIFASDKIKVYEFDTNETNNLAGRYNILYKKPGEKLATNTSSMKFLLFYKKSLSKYFEDCPQVSENASKGTYPKNATGFTAAAKDYAACK